MDSLVILSGAGISTDSGIPDFRGPAGAWTLDPQAQQRNTYQNFLSDPGLRAAYWRSRYAHPWHAEPNAGHLAVAELANSAIDTTVITQNTDGLHQRSGTPPDRVVELHGTIHMVECVGCQRRCPTGDILARIAAGEAVPRCEACGGILKTASTMFGQTMSREVYRRATRAVIACDLLLAVGTSLTVEPAGSLCASAVQSGSTLVIVNADPTPYDGIAAEIIRQPLSEALPRLAVQLLSGATLHRARTARLDGRELARLHRASAESGLTLPAQVVASAAATAILCGAADEDEALAALSHIPELRADDIRIRTARWLREMYPPAGAAPTPYWGDSLPHPPAEELVASVATARFLLPMLAETTEEQSRRALTVLARTATTRPGIRTCLVELLSVLPGLSPAAVDVALTGDHPAPLAAALTSLARTAALPAELLDAVPAGTTVLGEFPVLLAESLVEAYRARLDAYPESASRGLAHTLVELAERLADLGQAERALAVARRSVAAAEALADRAQLECATAALRRSQELNGIA